MLAASSVVRALLLGEFLLSSVTAWCQNQSTPAFAVSYSKRTANMTSGCVIVQRTSLTTPSRRNMGAVAQFIAHQPAADQMLTLQIYDLLGRMIFQKPVQDRRLSWDGCDREGPVASGLYFFCILTEHKPVSLQQHASSRLFEDATATALPEDTSHTRDAQIGDLDGDADLDLFIAHDNSRYGRQPQIFINNGKGVFRDETSARLPQMLLLTNQIELADVNQDGALDIYLANTMDGPNDPPPDILLMNDGQGHFRDETSERISQTWLGTQGIAAGDIDDDGDADLLAAALFDGVRVLINNGQGFFTDSSAQRLDASAFGAFDVTLLDVNQDRRLDVLLADILMVTTDENGTPLDSLSGQNAVFINQGNGYFRDETSSRHPVVVHDATVEIVAGDLDQDQDPDLFFTNVGFFEEESLNRLLINDGQGFFVDETFTRLPGEAVTWNNDAELIDFDGDHALDFFMPSVEPGVDASDLLFLNDGFGHFRDQSTIDLPQVMDFSAAAATGDLDGDTDVEILIANLPAQAAIGLSAQNRLYQNQSIATAVHEPNLDSPPRFFQLFASHPNPARAYATIRYHLPAAQLIQLQVYDLNGRLMRALVDHEQPAGDYAVRWNGRNELGVAAPAGIYFYRLIAGEKTVATRKLMLLGATEP